MRNLFDEKSIQEVIKRLNQLQPDKPPIWGKMNAAQMLAHCQEPFRVYFGETKIRQSFIGRIFGPLAKRKLYSNKPWPKNLPTAKGFKIADEREFDKERCKLISQVQRFSTSGILINTPRHPFFGKMNADEWSHLAYKHLDHHLQQFGV
jgi:hypothetical protein